MTSTPPSPVEDAVRSVLPAVRADLEALVRIPSVSATSPEEVGRSAAAVVELLRSAGLDDVRVLTSARPDGSAGMPAVVGRRPAPAGAPTVLLYAHHDVQPPGTPEGWTSPAFEPVEREGRLYARGAADDKAGVLVHVGALRALLPAWGADGGVGVVVFVEGEEEVGSPSFSAFLAEHRELLAADVVVVADSDNWSVDTPSLTTSLRGLVDATVTVRTLDHAVHSGMYGGPALDATTALVRLLDRLRDADGAVAVPGLRPTDGPEPAGLPEVTEERFRADAGVLDGVQLLGSGPLAQRLWHRAALTVIGVDVTPIERASNTLAASARARLSLRVPPGLAPSQAFGMLRDHLLATAPHGAHVEVELDESGQPFAGDVDGPVYDAARAALARAWGLPSPDDVVHAGVGGSIPFIAELVEAFPGATVLVTGVEDPDTRAHGHDESLSLAVFERALLAEALLLDSLA
ncbi:M20/M25/M40 family metallo-hydrolase [Quadrisphaera oryzae]|uniref:M20/M25/M40 family metallo-hydrolase n=1 Tax=Quadrisphaera TaxID=317661 RepID=UPI001646723D|nr:M20/M25/M40 family metallo-hydrolase [Quadrisphaera sp. RL12-1S]MBC3762356.1 M20/M25/M40 family metallo-hydrolase [Quadrisphaera sp. RL12-1S]